jgi:microbial collagenase
MRRRFLKRYNENLSTYESDRLKGQAIYDLMQGIDYDIQSYLQEIGKEANTAMWYGKIDAFINEVSKIALIHNVTDENGWLINNGIYYAGRLGGLHGNPARQPYHTSFEANWLESWNDLSLFFFSKLRSSFL